MDGIIRFIRKHDANYRTRNKHRERPFVADPFFVVSIAQVVGVNIP